ncbi:hypothetical protein [Dyella japonica]|uniref:hypothetical protein n=1 Tax=Dyella japonica TaxID=231455 RepID=UPI0012E04005|nr:hypothetical protein [Dyella japonica]
MFDELISGLFGGIFAKSFARFLRKFSLLATFLATLLMVHSAAFVIDLWSNGWRGAIEHTRTFVLTPVGIFVPFGIALAVAFIVFINAPKK